MSFPVCKHAKKRSSSVAGLRWLASEPFRLFFVSGALWSIVGVSLWPLFYAGQLGFYPNLCHARLMIEAFGGAFVVGFLGTAGPRMASAPKLTPWELIWLMALHQGTALAHLLLQHALGDALFVLMLLSLLGSLLIRVVRFRREPPPPQLGLALSGLVCGLAGGLLALMPDTALDPQRYRLSGLLLYQGLLLPPVLGIGSFVFPRMMGGGFGEAVSPVHVRRKRWRAGIAALLLVVSFFLEAYGRVFLGYALRTVVAGGYLWVEVRWRQHASDAPRGSLATFFYSQRLSIEHLLYVGGFGLLMLMVGSRVLFGHSGDLAGAERRSKWVRFLVFLGVLTATTRATPAWVPSTTVSHHIYAAITWALLAGLWLLWHRRRFLAREGS
jgi:uncharacterized protein involved in response to NO